MNGLPEPGPSPFTHPIGHARSRIQNRLYLNLKRIPGLVEPRFVESEAGIGGKIRADVETMVFANGVIPTGEASVHANWWPQPDDEQDWFQIHYADETGFDCGWHRQANEHVDGLGHYQERDGVGSAYEYESVTLDVENPVGILWDVVDERLPARLWSHYE